MRETLLEHNKKVVISAVEDTERLLVIGER